MSAEPRMQCSSPGMRNNPPVSTLGLVLPTNQEQSTGRKKKLHRLLWLERAILAAVTLAIGWEVAEIIARHL